MKLSFPLYFRVAVLSLLAAGSFYLGFYFYSIRDTKILAVGNITNFSASIVKATQEDFKLNIADKTEIISRSVLSTWPEKYVRSYTNEEDLRLRGDKIQPLIASLATKTNTKPVNARLNYAGNRAQVFSASAAGKELDIDQTIRAVLVAIYAGKNSADATVKYTEPEITLEKINQLGILTLIGTGESDFSGSPSSRIHNIKVSSEIFNGIIVKPGEEFSFNQLLGEVTASTGYKPELVIKSGKLEYEYGGGVCQVSTTMFRAAINSGFKITQRSPHSFPVKYYNPQGFDSTVYPGVVDLKFVNDTPAHILIQGKVTGSKLKFEIYGTNDGRHVVVEAPVQYDIQPTGAMKAYFNRTIVSASGVEKKETFRSTYKPPVKYEANPLE